MKDYIKAFIMPATVAVLLILGMVLFGAPSPQPAPVEAPKAVKADYYPSTAPPSAPPKLGGIRMACGTILRVISDLAANGIGR